jgi:hypothetical protein
VQVFRPAKKQSYRRDVLMAKTEPSQEKKKDRNYLKKDSHSKDSQPLVYSKKITFIGRGGG